LKRLKQSNMAARPLAAVLLWLGAAAVAAAEAHAGRTAAADQDRVDALPAWGDLQLKMFAG